MYASVTTKHPVLRTIVWILALHLSIFQAAPLLSAAEAEASGAEAEEAAESVERHESPSDLPAGLFTIGVLGNDEEVEGFGNVLVPVWYDGLSTLVFITPRITASDGDEQEMNIGAGVRYLCPNANVIIGANAFYDYRWTENDSEWSQYGFGLEVLSEWVDAGLV